MTWAYLVRHGEAGDRRRWHHPDESRPLNEHGRRQAEGLVALLADAEIDRLTSSAFVRCVQTLEPLAKVRGLPVATSAVLAEGAGGAGALELLRSGGALVACSHGDVIEEVLDLLVEDGVPLEGRPRGGPTPPDKKRTETPKGATWVLEVAGGALVKGTLLPPPA